MSAEPVTPAEELRAAATKLRAPLPRCLTASTARLIQSDSEAIDAVAWCDKPDHEPYTDCDHCHVVETHHAELAEVVVALYQAREPLAAWLDEAARQDDRNANRAPRHRFDLTHAVAMARAINGGAK